MIRKITAGFFPVLILFLFSDIASYAQEIKLLKGEIVTDSIPASGIHIVNLTRENGTTSDFSGRFEIRAALGDQILFSSVQLENRQLVVNHTQFDSGKIEVKLHPARNELDEISISDLKLSGYLEKDVFRIKIFDRNKFGIPFAAEKPTQIERHLHTASTSAGGIPMDLLLNTLNGKIAMLKKAKANDEMVILVKEVLNRVGEEFFISEFKILQSEIVNFIYYCARAPEFSQVVNAGNNLELIEYLRRKIDPFKEFREID